MKVLQANSFILGTEGSRLMQISLLRFFKNVHKFALCEFMPYAWVILEWIYEIINFTTNAFK